MAVFKIKYALQGICTAPSSSNDYHAHNPPLPSRHALAYPKAPRPVYPLPPCGRFYFWFFFSSSKNHFTDLLIASWRLTRGLYPKRFFALVIS